jgi:hypothetical protein
MRKLIVCGSLVAALSAPSIKASCQSAVNAYEFALGVMAAVCDANSPYYDQCPAATQAVFDAEYEVAVQCDGAGE